MFIEYDILGPYLNGAEEMAVQFYSFTYLPTVSPNHWKLIIIVSLRHFIPDSKLFAKSKIDVKLATLD